MTLWFPVGAVAAGAAVAAHGMFERNSPVFGGVLRHLTAPDAVALTFDDGPHPEITPRVLDALNEAGVHATFFVLGRYAVRWPRCSHSTFFRVLGVGQNMYPVLRVL